MWFRAFSRSRSMGSAKSVHLVMGAEADEEARVVLPSEQDAEITVDRECPVICQFTLQLVGPEQWVTRICGKAPQRSAKQLVTRRLELAGATFEA
jgi:hypothetical protein